MTPANNARLQAWNVEYLLPYAALATAIQDPRARGHYLHREVVLASSAGEILRDLSLRAATPVDIQPVRVPHPMFQHTVTARFREQFLLGLQFGVEAGLSAGRALEQIIERDTGPHRSRLNSALDALRRGRSFAEAFAALQLFDDATVAIVEAGELTGRMREALASAALHLSKSSALNKMLFGAVSWLMFDLVAAITSIIGTRFGLLPMLSKQGAGQVAPEEAEQFRHAISVATFAHDVLLAGTAVAVVMVLTLTFGYFGRSADLRARVDAVLLRLPLIAELLSNAAISATAGVMATLLKGGVAFLPASLITQRGTRLPTVVGYWERARSSVEAGDSVGQALAAAPMAGHECTMLRLHRDARQLATCFDLIATQRDELAKKAAKRFQLWAVVGTLLYSGVGVLLVLYVLYIQNQQLLHGASGG
jgi:type II secretory pathway component PulF